MRQMIISDRSHFLLHTHMLGMSFYTVRQLADKSWETLVDDDLGFAFDCLCGDPDKAIDMIVTAAWVTCPRCNMRGPLLDGEACSFCKLVL